MKNNVLLDQTTFETFSMQGHILDVQTKHTCSEFIHLTETITQKGKKANV